jgi:hypothetical protein
MLLVELISPGILESALQSVRTRKAVRPCGQPRGAARRALASDKPSALGRAALPGPLQVALPPGSRVVEQPARRRHEYCAPSPHSHLALTPGTAARPKWPSPVEARLRDPIGARRPPRPPNSLAVAPGRTELPCRDSQRSPADSGAHPGITIAPNSSLLRQAHRRP